MSEADELRRLITNIGLSARDAAGNGAAAAQEAKSATETLRVAIEYLKNSRVFALQEIGTLQEYIIPKTQELVQDTYSMELSDAAQGYTNALNRMVAWANFVANRIDQMERDIRIIEQQARDQIDSSGLSFRVATENIAEFASRL